MPRRLVVHAGFHKTGTTSIQRLLKHNRAALPDVQIILRPHMVALCEAARKYSVSRAAIDLGFVQYEAALVAETMRRDTILISSEDLSGHMPGRRGLTGYDAAPKLAAAMVEVWEEALPGTEILLVYSVRAPAPWLASCYDQHLRATRITTTREDYVDRFAASADLKTVVAEVNGMVEDAEVRSFALETASTARLGPGDALLALAGVPEAMRATLDPIAMANPGLSEAQQAAFLDLNRSDLPHAEIRARKTALS